MPLIKSRATDVAYAAGLIDGEGSIGAYASPKCPKNIRVTVKMSMVDRAGPEFMAATFGGNIRLEKRKTNSGKPIYSWALYCKKAAVCLEEMLPFLRIKQDRAKDAISLASMMKPRRSAKYYEFSDIELQDRFILVARIKAANRASNGRISGAIN